MAFLLKKGSNVTVRNSVRSGLLPLHIAAVEGHLDIVKLLVEHGVDINAKKTTKGGAQNALEMASEKNYSEIFAYLISRGAKGKVKQNDAKLPGHNVRICAFSDVVPPQFQYQQTFSLSTIASEVAQPSSLPSDTSLSLMSLGTAVRPWKTVRLFLSSTFVDMFAEREYLVKNVIPKLKEKCEERKIHLVEVDLRWGITEEESKSGRALQICMEEVENCEIFCNILGSRYGWIPDENVVPADVKVKYAWQKGLSITHMEIQNGALKKKKDPKCRAFFYIRDSSNFLNSIPSNVHFILICLHFI